MQITSYFIGVKLDSAQFVDLFIALQRYFQSHNIDQSVVLQNILSMHITMYYLDAGLGMDEETQLIDDASRLSIKYRDLSITELKVGHFGAKDDYRVCYLNCLPGGIFSEINQYLTGTYGHDHIPENQFEFVPHISLFRIVDVAIYQEHKDAIESLIGNHIKDIDVSTLAKDIRLYKVCSLYRPEIQIELN